MGLSTTIHAKWTADTYTVAFDKDGGTGTTDPITGVAYNATVTLPSAPTKAGNTPLAAGTLRSTEAAHNLQQPLR